MVRQPVKRLPGDRNSLPADRIRRHTTSPPAAARDGSAVRFEGSGARDSKPLSVPLVDVESLSQFRLHFLGEVDDLGELVSPVPRDAGVDQ